MAAEADEALSELDATESPDLGAAQLGLKWAHGNVTMKISSACSHSGCEACCAIVREREKYV